MKTKRVYRIRNWSEYTASLIQRGSVSVWISEEVQRQWYAPAGGRKGRPCLYSDIAIQAILVLRTVFRLPLRGIQGAIMSIFAIARIDLAIPNFSTLSRRMPKLAVDIGHDIPADDPLVIAVDGTGFKVFGEGEWKVRQHGVGKRRTWRKGHFAVVANGKYKGRIVAGQGTGSDVHDCEVMEELLYRIPNPLLAVAADGAYDTRWQRRLLDQRRAQPLIPPRDNACKWREEVCGEPILGAKRRNEALDRIAQIGMEDWKKEIGYHVRSLVENTNFRIKTLFGERLASRRKQGDTQDVEIALRMHALNAFSKFGMPESYVLPEARAA